MLGRFKEGSEASTIRERFETLKPYVKKFARAYARANWGIDLPDFVEEYEYRNAIGWRLAAPPFNKVSKTLAAFSPDYQKVCVNTTEFKRLMNESGPGETDQLSVLSAYIIAHEGVVHANCQLKEVPGENKDILTDWAIAFYKEADMSEIARKLEDKTVGVFLSGVNPEFHLDDGRKVFFGESVDETFATFLTIPMAASSLAFYLKYFEQDWMNNFLNQFPVIGKRVPKGALGAATDFYKARGRESVLLYFQGEFLNRYVLNLPGEQLQQSMLHLFFDEPGEFFRSLL